MKCVHPKCKQDPCYDDAAWHMQLKPHNDGIEQGYWWCANCRVVKHSINEQCSKCHSVIAVWIPLQQHKK